MRTCSIEGCNKEHKGHGFCVMHLRRFQKWGDPNFVQVVRPEEGSIGKFYKNVLLSNIDECINWPFNTTVMGYPVYKRNDKKTDLVHRQICEDVNGKPESNRLDVAHSCGNRLCVNPKHLRWATRKENHKDKIKHGTNGKKLTLEQVKQIRADKRYYKEIAKDYGVGVLAIHKIKTFKSWKDT